MKVRELTNFEKTSTICHDYFESHGSVGIRIKITGTVNEAIIKQALHKVQLDNILLQVTIQSENNNLFFVKEKFIPIPLTVINKENETQWKDLSCIEIKKKFNPTDGPLAKLFLLKSTHSTSHEILLIIHHAIIDIKSAALFFEALLQHYDIFLDASPTTASTQADKALDGIFHHQPIYSIKLSDPLLSIADFYLDQQLTNALVNKCHINNTSMFGMLAAVCLRIMQQEVGYKKTFTAVIPVDVRKFSATNKVDEKAFGCHIALYKGLKFDPNTELKFWELAKHYKSEFFNILDDFLNDPSRLEIYFPKNKIVKLIFILFYKLKKIMGDAASNNIGLLVINNCGNVSFKNNRNLLIKGFNWFANVTFLKKNRFFVNTIIINGELNVTIRSSFKNVSNEVIAQKFLNYLHEIVNNKII